MAAPKGNEYYKLAKGYGAKPKSYLPGSLWRKAIEYFQWNALNPLKEQKVFGSGYTATVDKLRAMTIVGFCNYAAMSRDTFNEYEKQEAYSDICKRIKDMIYQQKLEGAAADLLNASIIAREIGLTEKQDITTKGESLNNTGIENLTTEEKLALLRLKQKMRGDA